MLKWMFITNDPKLAKVAYKEGVQRLFVDWEINGKQERQGHLDTVISRHSFEDAVQLRRAVPGAELLVRINPFHDNTFGEVELALDAGADLIMLPMFNTQNEVKSLCQMVGGRAGVIPLLETPSSIEIVEDIVKVSGVAELYVGLNDLHLALNMDFMFEPVSKGMVEHVANVSKSADMRFGFGGVARVGEGIVPGDMVLGEHIRLGSSSVILSRTFYRAGMEEPKGKNPEQVFSSELASLRKVEKSLRERSEAQVKSDHEDFLSAVHKVVEVKQAQTK